MYCIAQNLGRVNFWWLAARIGREKFGESSTTGLSRIVYMVTLKNMAGKILAGLDKSTKSAKILHYMVCVYGSKSRGVGSCSELGVLQGI